MPTPYIISRLYTPIVRLGGVTPDAPAAESPPITAQRLPGSRRPHTDKVVAEVRRLIEHTDLSYKQIKARTNVDDGTISRWVRRGGWVRPPHAPRAADMVPTYRAGQLLKLRKLAARLEALAERYLRELEQSPDVEVETLMRALQALKMVRLHAQGGRRHRPFDRVPRTGAWTLSRDEAIRTALKEMRGGGGIDRATK
jgi:hypothetical protein